MTSQTKTYLKEDVYFEPLVHKWYAWPYLLPPVTAALNFTGRNIRLMKSFVNNHQLHISASKNPDLVGGDFVNCSEQQVEEVRSLIQDLQENHADYFEVREAITNLNELLAGQTGMSLEGLYASIPPILRGCVELVYDMEHHASFRLIEGLLYESSLYKESAQSVSLGTLSRLEERPFVLSSPRLPDADHLHFHLPFADPRLDRLFAMRTVGATDDEVRALFDGVTTEGGLPVEELFTSTPPVMSNPVLEGELRVRYLGHAGLMLETESVTIMIDPIIPSRDSKQSHQVFSFSELPAVIDYICVTHTHMDHVCIETLLQLRHKTRHVLVPKNSGGSLVDPSIKLMLQKIGFQVTEVEDMEEISGPFGKIKAIPFLGEHADLNIRSKTAWYYELAGKKIFCGADSSSLDEVMYERIWRAIGNIDLFFIGMECVGAPMSWLYGSLFTKPVPRATNESRRFNGSDFASAKKLVDIFKPLNVYIYALGMEPWFRYFMGVDYTPEARQIKESDLLIAYCAANNIRAERLFSKRTWEF